MSTAVAEKQDTEVARPLKILIPLIQQDFEAAEQAGMAYYKKAGEKLSEAREGHFEGDAPGFYAWAEKTFGKKRTQIRTYVALAEATERKSFKSLKHFVRETQHDRPTSGFIRREWTAPVDAVAERARKEAFRVAHEEQLTQAQEREADRKLAHRLIDIGYKVLATELHPDKVGGSKDAMSRLNRVRDKLKHSI